MVTNQIVHPYKHKGHKKIKWIKNLLSDFFVLGLFAIFPEAGGGGEKTVLYMFRKAGLLYIGVVIDGVCIRMSRHTHLLVFKVELF